MLSIGEYKQTFERYGGMMRTKQLQQEHILYRPLQKLIQNGYVEKIRYGYYQWVDNVDFSEAGVIVRLFPDAILCMDTALWHYGYSDRTPAAWHLAVSKDSGRSRFKVEYPFVKPYYIEPALLEIGKTVDRIDGHEVQIYNKDRVICDCLRYRNKMDREIFNKAIQSYVTDPDKNVPEMLKYAKALRVSRGAKELIGVWL